MVAKCREHRLEEMLMQKLPIPALLILFVSVLSAGATDKMPLWQHWEPGKIYHYNASMESEEIPDPGEEAGTSRSVMAQLDMTATQEPGTDRKLVAMKYVALRVLQNEDGQITTYDSANPSVSDPSMQEVFGVFVGKSVTFVYDKDDTLVDAKIPEELPRDGQEAMQLASTMCHELGFALPRQALAPGESFSLDKNTRINFAQPVLWKIKGRIESTAEHEGRKQMKLMMAGAAVMTDPQGEVTVIPGSRITTETLFDLERRCVTRSTTKNETRPPPGAASNGHRETWVTILKSMEDAPAGGGKPSPTANKSPR
jgi:hypothetical protein